MDLHPFLQEFRGTHVRILEDLGILQAQKDWPAFFNYCADSVHADHERREELFLFSAIASKAEIHAGGPMCMFYYDLHMQCPSLARAAMICNEPRRQPVQMDIPICIPLQDHMALEQILKKATRERAAPEHLEILAAVYIDILKVHFAKEDNCLLPMSQSLLTSEELDLCHARCASWSP